MKLIIDIPDEVYKDEKMCLYFGCYSRQLHSTLYNGIPLDKIRAEILNFKEKCNASDYLGCGILEIIDKYKSESEKV